MNAFTALRAEPSVSEAALWAERLREQGYCIIRNAAPAEDVAALAADLDQRFVQTPHCEGDFYGTRTKRFGGLLKRSRHAEKFVAHPEILEIAQDILGPFCDRIQLNLTQAIEILPGQRAQAPHRDQDMWRGETGRIEYLVNVMWPFTPFTEANGATIIWPGSHKRQKELLMPIEEAIFAEMQPGDALLFLGSTLHAGGANRTQAGRRGMIISYNLGWLKPFENQWLVYPPAIARYFPPLLAALVGYQQHRPNLGNVEGRCPSLLLRDALPDHAGAIDEMTQAQADLLASYFEAIEAGLPFEAREIPR
jgi:ectoine hydroxylase-related dioxygenase (phytanoyl-CoA dioxygenase family)